MCEIQVKKCIVPALPHKRVELRWQWYVEYTTSSS